MQEHSDVSRKAWRDAIAIVATLLLTLGGVARVATAEPPPPRDWDLELDLYGWIPRSDLELHGFSNGEHFGRHFDKDLGEAFGDLDGGGGGDVHFRWKRLVGLIDGAWVQTDENSDGWYTNDIIDGKLGVRVLDIPRPFMAGTGPNEPRFTVDLLGGARYRRAETNVDVVSINGARRFHDDREWVDPNVGLGLSVGLLPNLRLSTVADIGGFDAGNGSHLAWSVNPRLTYRAFDHLNLFVGWKHLQEDHDHYFDTTLSGPQAGLGYAF